MGSIDIPSFVLGAVVAILLVLVVAVLRRDMDPIRTGANAISSANRRRPTLPRPGTPRPQFGGSSSTFGATPSQQLSDLIRSGRKIEAIKLYRAQTGVGLREAKDAVEAQELRLRGVMDPRR
jgi:hypothetical protein